jgi:hypothetical protein
MGDYVGQNYYLPRGVREAVYNWVPFWKFPAQTASVTANQLVNKPLGFQSFIGYPTKTGSEIYNRALEQGYYEDQKGEGGFPTGTTDYFGNPKVMKSESVPFTTLAGLIRSITSPEQGVSDIIDNLSPAFEIKDILGQKGYRGMPATSKKYITDVKTGLRFAKDKEGNITGEEYEQTLPDYLKYLTTQGIKRMWAPAVFGERVARPFYYGLVDPVLRDVPFSEAQMYPMYSDELAPWSVGNTTSQPKTGLTEILGPQVGLKTQTIYPEQTSDFKQAIRRAARKAGRSYTIPKTQNNLFRDLFR